MPSIKCTNGKWKWGEYGECIYDTKAEADDDNADYYRDLEDIDLTPTQAMIDEATQGLQWREEFDRGGTEVGVATANAIINNEITIELVKRMYSYFKRHEVDKQAEGFESDQDGFPSAGRIAWALWSGDAGFEFAENKRNEIQEEEAEEERAKVGTIISDGIELPLYDTIEEAEAEAERLGGFGHHIHTIDGVEYFMPFESHEQAKESLKQTEETETEDNSVVRIWNKKFDNKTMEKRIFNIESRVEKNEDGKQIVFGHASVYDSRSEFMGFYEYIDKGAFTDDLIKRSDVRALINHDPNLVLARSKFGEGTLTLTPDEKGLAYAYELPETSYGKDLAINLKNGNISQSSFAFSVAKDGDSWSTDEEGNDIRTIKKIDYLYDISSVTYPAYSQAESDLIVAKRGLALYKEKQERKKEDIDLVARSLAKLKIELKKRKTNNN